MACGCIEPTSSMVFDVVEMYRLHGWNFKYCAEKVAARNGVNMSSLLSACGRRNKGRTYKKKKAPLVIPKYDVLVPKQTVLNFK